MKSIIYKIFLIFIVLTSASSAQRLLKITVSVNGKENVLSYITRMGNTYVSAKELAVLLSANYYYNETASKIEIKFSQYSLKFTAKNQFVVITSKTGNSQTVFQLPVSNLLVNNDVFVPIVYSLEYFALGYGKKLSYENKSKNLVISPEPSDINSFPTEKETPKEINTPAAVSTTTNSKYDIFGLSVEDKTNGTLIRLKASKNVNVPRHSINDNTLYVFFVNTSISPDILKGIKETGFVKKIKKTALSSKNIQLEITLKDGYSSSEVFRDVENNDIIITIHNKLLLNQPLSTVESKKSKWILDTIVLDAGHGGKDPGAIGMTGVKEKDVNLGVVSKLGKIIEKNLPDVKVVYTRKTDEFIELYKRGKIANEEGGKLFISVHCNSTPQKDIAHRGFEVYLLRPGRTKEAIDIAEFENSVIKYEDNPQRYQKLNDENFILVSMAHSQFMRYSEKFSDMLNQDWKRKVEIPAIGVKQAGFYVLVGASMPSVLIETGFLSNRKDEAYLKSSNGQSEIAGAIFSAVKKYKEYYDKEIQFVSGDENSK